MKIKARIPTLEEMKGEAATKGTSLREVASQYANPETVAKALGVDGVSYSSKALDPSKRYLKAGAEVTVEISHGEWGKLEVPFSSDVVLTPGQLALFSRVEILRGDYGNGTYTLRSNMSVYDPEVGHLLKTLEQGAMVAGGVDVRMDSFPYVSFTTASFLTTEKTELMQGLFPHLTWRERITFERLVLSHHFNQPTFELVANADDLEAQHLLRKLHGILAIEEESRSIGYNQGADLPTQITFGINAFDRLIKEGISGEDAAYINSMVSMNPYKSRNQEYLYPEELGTRENPLWVPISDRASGELKAKEEGEGLTIFEKEMRTAMTTVIDQWRKKHGTPPTSIIVEILYDPKRQVWAVCTDNNVMGNNIPEEFRQQVLQAAELTVRDYLPSLEDIGTTSSVPQFRMKYIVT